jgi:hypothetical protein
MKLLASRRIALLTNNQWVPGSSPGGARKNPATSHESWIFLDIGPGWVLGLGLGARRVQLLRSGARYTLKVVLSIS